MKISLPFKIVVDATTSSRYRDGLRPADWDLRVDGVDMIEANGIGSLRLFSDGSQSPPAAGWTIILTSGDPQSGYRWTLYGLPREAPVAAQ